MEDKNFNLEDVENVFKKYTENQQKMIEDKLKAFTPLSEDKVKEIVSKKVMEFDVPLVKGEVSTPFDEFKKYMREVNTVKKEK